MDLTFRTKLVFLVTALSLVACDPDPGADAGDSGGLDTGPADTGPADTGAEDTAMPDAGPPCEGPPGLYEDTHCSVLAAGVREFEPRFPLWSDGTEKDRYIFLPAMPIDNSDPDSWVFPVGTRIYKTFSIGGVRLETRMFEKTSVGAGRSTWMIRTFAWNEEQTAVMDVTEADVVFRTDVLGTDHDIPNGLQCVECHGGVFDLAAGFSAIQLNHAGPGVTLTELAAESGRFTEAVIVGDADVPGDATEQAGLGYLHANCGTCHRFRIFQPDTACGTPPCGDCGGASACGTFLHMWLRVQDETVDDTRAFASAVGVYSSHGSFAPDATCRIAAGDASASVLVRRMETRGSQPQMPPIGTELVDTDGVAAVSAWINALPAGPTTCTP